MKRRSDFRYHCRVCGRELIYISRRKNHKTVRSRIEAYHAGRELPYYSTICEPPNGSWRREAIRRLEKECFAKWGHYRQAKTLEQAEDLVRYNCGYTIGQLAQMRDVEFFELYAMTLRTQLAEATRKALDVLIKSEAFGMNAQELNECH